MINILLIILVIIPFIVYPLILFFQGLFDSRVDRGFKILFFFSLFFMFPLSSFIYGAMIRQSMLSKIMLVITVLFFIGALVFGFLYGFNSIEESRYRSDDTKVEKTVDQQDQIEEDSKAEVQYKGYNTYDVRDDNVFVSKKRKEEN